MNKELNAVEKLKSCCLDLQFKRRDVVDIALDIEKYSKIIETALKKLNNIETASIDIEQENQALYKENKKLKQALELIKDLAKVYDVEFCDKDQTMSFKIRLRNKFVLETIRFKSKEEYDSLKEVLL